MSGNITQLFGSPFVNPPEPIPIQEQIRTAMLSAGITPPGQIIVDGNLHRFSTKQGDPTDDSGWYAIFPDGIQAGKFGDWRQGIEMNFKANVGRELSAAEAHAIHMRQVEAKKRRDELIAKKRSDASAECALIWSKASAADEEHPYLLKKGINYNGSRLSGDGRLIVPLYGSDGVISSLQYIDQEGEKRYYPGGATGGKYWVIGGPIKDKAYMAEGFATAATIHEETSQPVIVAYSANNIPPVLKEIRELYPTLTITIVADNDKSGVGQNYANQAAAKYGAMVIVPPCDGDANDFRQQGGDLKTLLNPGNNLVDKMKLIFGDDLGAEYEAPNEVIQGLIVAKTQTVIYGDSNSGKTFFALSLAKAIAEGEDCYGRKVEKGVVLYLATEAPGSIRSRMQALKKYYGCSLSNLAMIPVPLNFYSNASDSLSVIEIVNEIEKIKGQKVKMIIGDTLARMSAGANENSGEDMGPVMERWSAVCEKTGAAVVIIHHNGKDTAKGARGWSGIRAHIDTEIEVIESNGARTATITKQRELSSKGNEINFDLEIVEMGIGKFGDQVTTCVAVPSENSAKKSKKHDTTTQRNIRELRDAWFDSGAELEDGKPYISKMALKNYLVTRLDKSESSAKKEVLITSGRMMTRLYESGIVLDSEYGFIVCDIDICDAWMIQRDK